MLISLALFCINGTIAFHVTASIKTLFSTKLQLSSVPELRRCKCASLTFGLGFGGVTPWYLTPLMGYQVGG